MPRPPDNYTHSQFEPVASDRQGETVQCVHCRNWTGSIKTLNRKKAHLLNCPQYAQWRAAGNGQDLAPPNKYHKRDSMALDAWDRGEAGARNPYLNSSPYGYGPGPDHTPTMVRGRNLDTSKFFDEFWDDTTNQKCMRVRCLHCGFSRAKNTTRQVEHLAQCQPFLSSNEGQQAIANGELEMTPAGGRPSMNGSDIWRGGAPNPAIRVEASSQARNSSGHFGSNHMAPPRPAPSLASHLLNKYPQMLSKATQQQFLSHAGCGTLSAGALSRWLGQNSHISRAMISFVGTLIGKVRLPETANSKQHTQYRTLDLLISTISNLRKEIDFIENTKRKYNIQTDREPPSPLTKAYVNLLASCADPRATLLEGMVALWATEHCYCLSWRYASTFVDNMPSSNYSVPSYLTQSSTDPFSNGSATTRTTTGSVQHMSALSEALIPNWTSREFSKFVDACRAIVDELANAETTGSGREQLQKCEDQYQEVLFWWTRIWPEVNGMGEQNGVGGDAVRDSESQGPDTTSPTDIAGPSGTHGANSSNNDNHVGKAEPIEIEDDDEENGEREDDAPVDSVDSPYGGTGLGAVAAANEAEV